MKTMSGLYDRSHERDACGIGLVARLDGTPEHRSIADGLEILRNLEHRGAVSGDGRTGDGAGLLCAIPDVFFRAEFKGTLPPPDAEDGAVAWGAGLPYAIGMFFLPRDVAGGKTATSLVEYMAAREGLSVIGWRDVPVVPQVLGDRARVSMPRIVQAAFARPDGLGGRAGSESFERRLYAFRKSLEREAAAAGFALEDFSVPSLSSRTIVYKGMFVAGQFESFYPDLGRADFKSPYSIVHQRYSTNTVPSWPLAQPFRMISHNGEINTLRKNVNAMRARQSTLETSAFGGDLARIFPIVQEEGSDSAMFDNVFELLVRAGRSPEHAFMMMVPEPYESMEPSPRRSFYEYHSALMEPWDGPAAMVFTDGVTIGAAADRNGLRPFRYSVTADGRFVGASEAGALELDESTVVEKGKLSPGRMLALDLAAGRILRDGEIKDAVCGRKPYGSWLAEGAISLPGLCEAAMEPESAAADGRTPGEADPRLDAFFGLDAAELKVIEPMARDGKEATAAMGTRKPPAVLEGAPRPLFGYFKQLFAQVTNPPIDPVREGLVMSLSGFVGRERNLLDESPLHCSQLRLRQPLLSNADLRRLNEADLPAFKVCSVSTTYAIDPNDAGTAPAPGSRLKAAVEALRTAVQLRVDEGYSLVILSDRSMGEGRLAIPALLAVAAAHRKLVETRRRHMTGLVIETAEAHEIHHASLLVAYGASAVNPWLVFERLPSMAAALGGGESSGHGLAAGKAAANYVKAVGDGMRKTMSKMGISTIASYRGSGLYEAVGLSKSLVDDYFPGTESRLGGIGLSEIEADLLSRHEAAYGSKSAAGAGPGAGRGIGGRSEATEVPWPPRLAALLTKAVREDDQASYRAYADGIASTERPAFALRDLFDLKPGRELDLAAVEGWQSIASRFSIAAMSCGALGPEAHEALAAGANSVGAWSGSGEGGEDEARAVPGPDGVDRRSASRQVASARFGVDARYVAGARELQIKAAQGAKPGEGGQLPGAKVDAYVAMLRHATPGLPLISPPPHHDIYSIEDLAQLIHDLRCVNPTARISIKLAAQAGIGTVAAGTAKAGVDCVVVSAGDGGTGSSPLSSLDYAGNAWELSLPEVGQVLAMNGMSDRVSVQVDGRLRAGRDVVIAAILGAREFAFGTAAMIAVGCVACGQCDKDRCPAGIATQKPELRARFAGSAEHVRRFIRMTAEDTRRVLSSIGARSLDEVEGRYDLIDFRGRPRGGKDALLDFSKVAEALEVAKRYRTMVSEGDEGTGSLVVPPPPAGLRAWASSWRAPFKAPEPDAELFEPVAAALAAGTRFEATRTLRNSDRSIGAALSGELVRRGLDRSAGSATVRFSGSAGQSFGAFLVSGLRFVLEGQANDFVGKALSGGTVVVKPQASRRFEAAENTVAGNVCLFGATAGRLHVHGRAGERFAVRNSGAAAVVEGVGDHACEYMTGGRVTILGPTGRNFGAGMTGGAAFVLDDSGDLEGRLAAGAVAAGPVESADDLSALESELRAHAAETGSAAAAAILAAWPGAASRFRKVAPLA